MDDLNVPQLSHLTREWDKQWNPVCVPECPRCAADAVEPSHRTVVVPESVPLFCFDCHDTEAPQYVLARKAGKYIALCHKPGTNHGCWERHIRPVCKYEDNEGVQCLNQAEWMVAFGQDMLMRTERCLLHVAPALSDVSEHRIFPL